MNELSFSEKAILILDDDRFMANILRSILDIFEVSHVRVTASTKDAIKILEDKPYDCVIVDNLMSADHGMTLVKHIRNSQRDNLRKMPIILCTAFTDLHSILNARDTGVTEVLAKPVSPEQIFGKLSNALFNPRDFIISNTFSGPDRRRRTSSAEDTPERRRDNEIPLPEQQQPPPPGDQ